MQRVEKIFSASRDNYTESYRENLSTNEIIAFVEPPNKASHRVLEKCGMRNLGLVKCHYGELEKYEITRQTWEKHDEA